MCETNDKNAQQQQQQEQRDRQAALEAEMTARGVDVLAKQITDAQTAGLESTTPYGSHLVRRAIKPVADGIRTFLQETATGKVGRRHVAAGYLRKVSPDVAAFLALRSCLNSITKRKTLQNVAVLVGNALETEVKLAHFEAVNPKEYRHATRLVAHSGHEHYKQAVYSIMAGRNDATMPSWPLRDKLLLGQKLIEIVRDTTGYISIDEAGSGQNKMYHVAGTQSCLDWIHKAIGSSTLATPDYLPTITPPRPWSGPYGGGYYTLLKPLKLVKNAQRNYLEELSLCADEMPVLYEAINAMQETPFRINRDVLTVMRQLWDNGGDMAGLPSRDAYPLPRCPLCGAEIPPASRLNGISHACFETPEAAETLATWKKDAKRVYEKNIAAFSKRIQLARVMALAERFQHEAAIYFPMQLDFRGRVYAVPSFLNPQGADPAKGLLTFANGKPLHTPESVTWLCIHGANTWGNDKVSLEERQAWVMEHEAMILGIAENPYDVRDWQTADKPWQFLAFCFEWAAYKRAIAQGKVFISSLPVAMDGTCNGLQIFSLMLQDETGGTATNLVPCEKPQDIYQIVADKTTAKLTALLTTGTLQAKKTGEPWYDERNMAARLLALGITRKSTKRQVMVLPYGGTFQSCCEYTREHLEERMEQEPGSSAFGEQGLNPGNLHAAAIFLARLIWDAIGETVVAAREAMSFLQNMASLAASEGLPVHWHTPVGFLVSQAYYDQSEYRVKTRLGATIIRLAVKQEDTETTGGNDTDDKPVKRIDKRRQRNGISPNFVHSLDSAAMCLSISKARARGVTSFMMIHDSYGTPAADAPAMALSLREAFVSMFSGCNVLERFRDEVAPMLSEGNRQKLPPLPCKGRLDVTKVLQSAFFFA